MSFVQASAYGSGEFGSGSYEGGETSTPTSSSGGGSSTSSGSSGGAFTPSIQFDIKILTFESPVSLGESFDFTYFIKGVGNVNNDVTINFWIEKDGETITSGSDVIFMGNNEEKTEAASLFLPTGVESGTYRFNIKVNLGSISAESHRTIELLVDGDTATINQLFSIGFSLEEILLRSSDELLSIVTMENFDESPATIELDFKILDESGEVLDEESETWIVRLRGVSRKSFPGLDLQDGRYTFVVETLYNSRFADEFRQDFEVRENLVSPTLETDAIYIALGVSTLAIIILSLIIIMIAHSKIRRRKNKSKKTRKAKKSSKVSEMTLARKKLIRK